MEDSPEEMFLRIQDIGIETAVLLLEYIGFMLNNIGPYIKCEAKRLMNKGVFDSHDYAYYKKGVKVVSRHYYRHRKRILNYLYRRIVYKIIAEQMIMQNKGISLENYDPYNRFLEILEEIENKYINDLNKEYVRLDLKKAVEYFKKNYQHIANRFLR